MSDSDDAGRIGLVDGSVESDSRTFHVVLEPTTLIQLDELVAVATELGPRRRWVRGRFSRGEPNLPAGSLLRPVRVDPDELVGSGNPLGHDRGVGPGFHQLEGRNVVR